jgi:hypothetical protein
MHQSGGSLQSLDVMIKMLLGQQLGACLQQSQKLMKRQPFMRVEH